MTQERELISLERAESPYFVGVDLGGTNVKVGVVDDSDFEPVTRPDLVLGRRDGGRV